MLNSKWKMFYCFVRACLCVINDVYSITNNMLCRNNSWVIHGTSFFLPFLKLSQVLMLSDSSLKALWHLATLNSEDCWLARSQIISQLIGQTLVQLSQCFHHPPSSNGDNYIIFAPSSPTAPSLCWWSQVDLNYKARRKKDVFFLIFFYLFFCLK